MLKQGNYLTVIKPLAHKIGLEETIILMELVGMEEYKEQKQELREEILKSDNKKINRNKAIFYKKDRAFECTATELELATTIKRKKQITILNRMAEMNLLSVDQRGLPAKRFIVLNHENIDKVLEDSISEYQDFRDKFIEEKRELTRIQMEKRKQKNNQNSLLSQKGTTDNTNGLKTEKKKKSHNDQLSQKGTTRNPESKQQVVPNEDNLNNIPSIKISSFNNSIYHKKVGKLEIEDLIKSVLIKNIDRLIDDQIDLEDIKLLWETEKSNEDGLNVYQFADMLKTALTEAKEPIGSRGSVSNFFKAAIKKYKQNLVVPVPQSSSSHKKEVLPDWWETRKQNEGNQEKEKKLTEEQIKEQKELDKLLQAFK